MGAGALNLIKLCVGTDDPAALRTWQEQRRRETGRSHSFHITRMWPKRAEALLDGGSLYWVMRGLVQARQTITALEEVTGADGIRRCAILLDPQIILTTTAPRRPFQGWRYLNAEDAPPDLTSGSAQDAALPVPLQMALGEIGVR